MDGVTTTEDRPIHIFTIERFGIQGEHKCLIWPRDFDVATLRILLAYSDTTTG
jgi:hypothetical protein